jgi:7,8-dihydroneopterin aldolase/epimerase/oxygenase
LAQRLADVCLAHALVDAVEVTVHKPDAPVGLPVSDLLVRIRRERRR